MNVPRFGVFALLTDQSMSAVEVALAAEARPIESLWLGEHSHMPVDTVHPYTSDGSIPESYKRTVDALISLATVASVTSRLRLGTSVTLLAEHNPIRLAKEIATLDHVSGGGSRSASGMAGIGSRRPTTAFLPPSVDSYSGKSSRRWNSSGAKTPQVSEASGSPSGKAGRGRSPCKSRDRQYCSEHPQLRIHFVTWQSSWMVGCPCN